MKKTIKVNERFLRISHWKRDWVPMENPLEMDKDVKLEIIGQVSGVEYESNNDGTVDEIFIIKGLLAEEVKIKDE